MKLQDILEKVDQQSKKRVAVAQAADKEVLTAVKHAIEHDLANFLLVGEESEIQRIAEAVELDLSDKRIELKHVSDQSLTATEAVKSVSEGYADVVMKGQIDTKLVLKAVLNKDYGLRAGKVLSHVAVFEVPNRERFVLLTDSGMNITPTLEEKAQIISNAVEVANGLGIELPKVAPLAAVEVVNPTMPATVDAAALTQMQKRGQIKGCIVDGPLAFDNAVSIEAANQKGIQSEVAGQADILLVPAIEVANALYKSFVYFAGAKVAGVISGAKAPIVLTSRSDTAESKLYSLALALLTSKEN
ncbi:MULTISPECIES: phosphate butyryltransferase [Pontibacillus]|uniref:Phosphate butyryltransferase n=1 Tax=Pontibacillus chungwhensis TaxID=265426 RepID=A0ABY8UT77_9BACI|nr:MULTISPECIES: phosphate butyryltransferase [Pontibacillus]MCD5323497.1 phosphate butyryltransferase [Pontibacillus sp. HN14]WIF96872.1 phosphate butyryltransferase [Pontibacillus chungwhensis]